MNKYHAVFHGRPIGAIGIFHTCEADVEAETVDEARLKLYDKFEHISGCHIEETAAIRYVPTYIGRDGLRTLMRAAQGRDTFATANEAQKWLEAVTQNNSADVLRRSYGEQPAFEVRPCECWPGHFDPKGIYFDDRTMEDI